MKSIKEKAEEYAKTKHTNKNLIEIVSWDFEAGANYVLVAIEKVFKENTNPISPDSHVLYCIKNVIEQLKSNQK